MYVSAAASLPSSASPTRQLYARAPILETVLEIRCSSKHGHDVGLLGALRKHVPEYTDVQPVYEIAGQFALHLSGQTTGSQQQRHAGFQFADPVQQRIFLAESGRFSFSKLAPYSRWELVRDEAARLWQIYAKATKVKSVERIGVRYINRIDIPGQTVALKDWLLTAPDVAPAIQDHMTNFAMQLDLQMPGVHGAAATIRQAVVQPPNPNVVSVMLDIDVHRTAKIGGDDIWPTLEWLHQRENHFFEASITDRVRAIIK